MLEWQRDWAHKDTYDAVMDIVKTHSGPTASAWSTPTRWSTALRRRSFLNIRAPVLAGSHK